MVERKVSVLKCNKCDDKNSRLFLVGDFTFRTLSDEHCTKCKAKNSLEIIEIYSEWIDPKDKKPLSE